MKTKAAVLFELGKPLQIEELHLPDLEPGQVLVKVAYSGICHSQLMEVSGKRGEDRFLPHLLGHEGAGIVVDVGEKVTKVEKNDKIVLTWIKGKGINCNGAKYSKDGLVINSGAVTTFATYTIVSENRCVKIHEDISLDIACLLGCAVPTGAGIVLRSLKPQKQNSILIYGVGGIGLSALMAAKLCQCGTIIAVDITDDKLDLAKVFGATHVVNAKQESVLKYVNIVTENEGVDYAIESAGKVETIEVAFDTVRKNGGICYFASHPEAGGKIKLDPFDLICGKEIKGSWGGESIPDEDIPLFVQMYREGKLPLERLIGKRYPFEQINAAMDELQKGVLGRVVIEMGL